MPSIDYPSNPIAGQTATYSNGNVVIFDGSAWRSPSFLSSGTTGPQGSTGIGQRGGLLYTKIEANNLPASGQISFGVSEDFTFQIYVSKTTANGENVTDLLSSYSLPLRFTLQNGLTGSYFLTSNIDLITSTSTYYVYNFPQIENYIQPANGSQLVLDFIKNGPTGSQGPTGTINYLITYRRLTSSSTLDSTDLSTVNSGSPLIIEMNVGTANSLTVPLNSTVGFSLGTQITISQYGVGQTTIVAATSSITLRSTGSFLKLAAQYSMATLMKVGTNEWYVVGQLAP
jgi:hypothetical protein